MKGKASTAALRPILQSRSSLPECSPCHPASGHLSRESKSSHPRHLLRTVASRPQFDESFYCLTDGYLGRGGIPL